MTLTPTSTPSLSAPSQSTVTASLMAIREAVTVLCDGAESEGVEVGVKVMAFVAVYS